MKGIAILAVALIIFPLATVAEEMEEEPPTNPLYVIASQLNGRAGPTKKAKIEALFDYGDALEPTGRVSKDWEWIEVYGGEGGTVWVCTRYVSERFWEFTVINENNGRVKIRSIPNSGKLRGYVKHGKSIDIDQVIMGWGHCFKGWVDLEYFIEEID